jgi:hypothetical protein
MSQTFVVCHEDRKSLVGFGSAGSLRAERALARVDRGLSFGRVGSVKGEQVRHLR